jgi:NAC domain
MLTGGTDSGIRGDSQLLILKELTDKLSQGQTGDSKGTLKRQEVSSSASSTH